MHRMQVFYSITVTAETQSFLDKVKNLFANEPHFSQANTTFRVLSYPKLNQCFKEKKTCVSKF